MEAMGVDGKKPYVVAVIVQVIYAGMFVVSKAAFDQGMNTFVFIFYRQAAASLLLLPLAILLERKNARSMTFRLLLKLFLYALIGTTFSLNVYNMSLKFTSAPVGSATSNSMPVITFFLALLLRMEVVKPKSPSGMAKLSGIALCLAGVLVIAFYAGLSLRPINHHRAFNVGSDARSGDTDHALWIKGTFLMVLANVTWSLWIILQAALLREYPNKLLVTATQCVFSTAQCFLVAAVAEGDFSRWRLRFDVTLLAVVYTGFVVTGVSYYLQAWCTEMRGPVFLAAWNPLCFVITIFCSSFLGEIVHLGSILGGALLVGGLYAVLWGKSKEDRIVPCGEMSTVDGSESAEVAKSKQETTMENVRDEKTMLSSGAEEV